MRMPVTFRVFPSTATSHAHDIYLLLGIIARVMVMVVGLVLVCLFTALQVPSYRPHCLESAWLEKAWIRGPIVIVLSFSFLSGLLLFEGKGPRWPLVTLHVIGHQWYWEYEIIFPVKNSLEEEGGSVVGKAARTFTVDSYCLRGELGPGERRLTSVDAHLLAPTRVGIRMIITSADVIHNYNIKSLALSVDAVPGRLHHTRMRCHFTGIFSGWCSENCGVGHFSMPCVMEFIPFDK